MFKSDKCNASFVLESVKKIIYEQKEYKNCTNIPIMPKVAKINYLDAGKSYNQRSWSHPQIEWIKSNIDASTSRRNQKRPLAMFA